MKKTATMIFMLLFLIVAVIPAFSHCQIPCGIYHDKLRINLIQEHIETIEKSMNEIKRISKEENKDYNQLIRWTVNKEQHADFIMEIVTDYFLTQRIIIIEDTESEQYKEYCNKLAILHQMLVYSMKSKQTTDLKNAEKLKELLQEFDKAYFNRHNHH